MYIVEIEQMNVYWFSFQRCSVSSSLIEIMQWLNSFNIKVLLGIVIWHCLFLTGTSHGVTPFNKIFICWAKDWTTFSYPGWQNPHSVFWDEWSSPLVSILKVISEMNQRSVNHSLVVIFWNPFALTELLHYQIWKHYSGHTSPRLCYLPNMLVLEITSRWGRFHLD